MISLIDISFFVGERNIPNTDTPEVASSLNLFILKHEQVLLKEVLGYDLYAALQAGLAADPVAQRWQDLVFGKVYTDYRGRQTQWRGLVDTDSNYYSFNAGTATRKAPQWLEVGVTTDEGGVIIPDQATTFVFTDAIGWTPESINRIGAGPMQEGVEYSWDAETGTFALLQTGDKFQLNERLFWEYQIRLNTEVVSSEFTYKQSCIADYVYFYYLRNQATSTTGTGEKSVTIANAINVSNATKMRSAWNEMSDWLGELWVYLDATKNTYAEWYGRDYCLENRYGFISII